jgi:hypothetical protein
MRLDNSLEVTIAEPNNASLHDRRPKQFIYYRFALDHNSNRGAAALFSIVNHVKCNNGQPYDAKMGSSRRGGRVVDCGGLENR